MSKLGIIAAAEAAHATAAAHADPAAERCRQDILILERCVDACRTYTTDKVVIANVRKELQPYFEPSPDINLFSMALMHHVQNPEDVNLFECTKWVYWQLLKRKG